MKNEFNTIYNFEEVESKLYKIWERSGYFNPDRLPGSRKKSFVIVAPPPNITGSLHMGHALNTTIQDILIRKKRMEGYLALWVPGTDHAGIATQNVVEKELKKQGLTRYDLGREKFIEKVWEWKEKYGHIILDQLKKIGASMDWSRIRFTMDPFYQRAVTEAFLRYYRKGLIYQAEKVINWCVRCATSLSDLELERSEENATLYYINYPLVDGSGFITVATVRPETMLGDAAIAVNPRDNRYKKFIGKKVILPLQEREIPVIADKAIDLNFGTGAVKITPAHDFLDEEIGNRHQLSFYKIIGLNGKMTEAAGKAYEGLKILECRLKVVDELKKKNLLVKEEVYCHNVVRCYRCGTIIEPIPSLQWFVKMDSLARLAIQALRSGKIKFHPKRWEKVYFSWLNNIKDWCISRQIWWGHKIPIQGVEDVLDTWFSSALWPFAVMGWPRQTKDLKKFYPTNVLSTARDIINLWVTRMIFSSLEFTGKIPFFDVIIHATVLTKDGKRMSKSLGTGVDPMELISKFGADATRFGLIWQLMGGQDMRWSEEHVLAGKKFANKIWNASRFVWMQLQGKKNIKIQKPLAKTRADRKILAKLQEVYKEVNVNIDNYYFGQALHKLYQFFWHDFCDVYLEISKKQMEDKKLERSTAQILLYVLFSSLKLLHPFMPFITEEIYQRMLIPYANIKGSKAKKFLMIENWRV